MEDEKNKAEFRLQIHAIDGVWMNTLPIADVALTESAAKAILTRLGELMTERHREAVAVTE